MRSLGLTNRLSPRTEARVSVTILALFFFAFSSYIYDLGFHPEKEGLYGEMAEQILRGRLPHLDHEAPAVGGADFLHAFALAVLGHNVLSLRLCVLTVASVSLLFGLLILRRSLTIGSAFGVAVACFLWGPAAYLVPDPRWYGCALAIIGAYFLLKFRETDRVFWLYVSGTVAGITLTFHLASGLLQVLAASFFLFLLDRLSDGSEPAEPSVTSGNDYPWPLRASILLPGIGLLLYVLWQRGRVDGLLYFALGPVLLGTWLLLPAPSLPQRQRRSRLSGKAIFPYLAAAFLTALAFLLPFVAREGLEAVKAVGVGAVAGGIRAAQDSKGQLPGTDGLLGLIVLGVAAILLCFLCRKRAPSWSVALVAAAVASALIYLLCSPLDETYPVTWSTLRLLVPATGLAGIVLLALAHRGTIRWGVAHRDRVALVASFAVCLNLLQFPECSGASFLYAFPFCLLLLGVLAGPSLSTDDPETRPVAIWALRGSAMIWLGFLIVFSWSYVVSANADRYAERWFPERYDDKVRIERAPVFTSDSECRIYEGLEQMLKSASPDTEVPIIAFPECQAILFLTGRRNAFAGYGIPDHKAGELWRPVLQTIEQKRVSAVVYRPERDPDERFLPEPELAGLLSAFTPTLHGNYLLFLRWPRSQDPVRGVTVRDPPRIKKKWPW